MLDSQGQGQGCARGVNAKMTICVSGVGVQILATGRGAHGAGEQDAPRHTKRSVTACRISGFNMHMAADTKPCKWASVPPVHAANGERKGSMKMMAKAGTHRKRSEHTMRMK
eukprot:scaffold7701_cov28-Tisochrysis_lutea.AAC.2